MYIRATSSRGRLFAASRALAAAGVAVLTLLPLAGPVAAETEITIEAHAQLAGHVRPGAWSEVYVFIQNNGPAVLGELRVRTQAQGSSQFGVAADLPSGARKEFWLYAQPPLFGSTLKVDLVVDDTVLTTVDVPIKSHDAYSPIVAIVAEHPEGFERDVTSAAAPNPQFGGQATSVLKLQPADLPQRVEAWSAIDRLIWQDVDTASLSAGQLKAMQLWVGAGGRLVILGGTTGTTTLTALPAEMLPFTPSQTVDVPTADLVPLLGQLPDGAASVTALAGLLDRGTVLGRTGDLVYAAQASYGQGQVTIIGVDPATAWLTRSVAADTLWQRLLPSTTSPTISPFIFADDSSLLYALQNLPSVALPPIESLFLLLLAYIALIGPLNYLILRRLDKREWAWVTMPALVAIFAVGSYGLGATLKGSDVIVNEVSIVRANQGTEFGRAQSYIGVYSPSRRSFNVQIGEGALLSNTNSQIQSGQTDQPLDVLIGTTTSELRNFEVGFGVLRGFRAEAAAAAPKIDAELTLTAGNVTGTVTNNSTVALENVALVFAGNVVARPSLGPGETWQVTLEPDASSMFGYQLSERIFGSTFPRDAVEQRKLQTRRSVIDTLSQYSSNIVGTPSDVPLLIGWQETPALDVQLSGEQPTRVGDSVYLVPLSMSYAAQAVFTGSLMTATIVDSDSDQAFFDGQSFNLGSGTMTVELRPAGLNGTLRTSSLELSLTQGNFLNLRGNGQRIEPLPADQQPDQLDPLVGLVENPNGTIPSPAAEPASTEVPVAPPVPVPAPGKPEPVPCCGEGEFDPLPDLQLFNFSDGKWYEFAHFGANLSYVITDPQQYVDLNGRVLLRLVNRNDTGEGKYFQLLARLEGTIE